ncbi:amidohydrolase [Stackebrandtia nassauensis]|uniref:Amidohydrolase 3 n=1 Tax=Stackebrandtia nassauensis (strain DSM 44728 / CIP 108903 / NRRL B-16338 / NBRC 102104 / LLR-40K-21) TaxID=446470 RepID=D3PZR6_STANL|nr:amidohydrolase family protein [Stackebrandtia nassauensis]ADD43603.1 Amidohydrolase 3 [Stackebrandtia nassauensis DSM 44728]
MNATHTTLYRGGHVLSPAYPNATALAITDGRVSWLGVDADAPAADETVELDGCLVTPAFVDSHAHVTGTGNALSGLNLDGTGSATELLDRVADAAKATSQHAIIMGHGFDETEWDDPALPTGVELARAVGGRRAYLSRTCGHTGIASAALLLERPDLAELEGYDDSGVLTLHAHKAARAAAAAAIPDTQRTQVQRVALKHAASLGIAAVVECGMVTPGSSVGEDDFTGLLALAASGEPLPRVFGYWGELCAAAKARELGAHACAGDLSVDGSIGAHTAAVTQPYADADTTGHAYLSAEDVEQHIINCSGQGLQGGFHAIGDQAIHNVLTGIAAAAQTVGLEVIRNGRHRVEHAELLDKQMIAGFVSFGLYASVQPSFDARWGGTEAMYATRLGAERSLAANPFGSLAGVGVPLALGSDSPVTPLDPWGGVRAAVNHHNPSQRLSPTAAFAAHTRGGWRATGDDEAGVLAPGAPATLAVWDHRQPGLPDVGPDSVNPRCRRTVHNGTVIFDEE